MQKVNVSEIQEKEVKESTFLKPGVHDCKINPWTVSEGQYEGVVLNVESDGKAFSESLSMPSDSSDDSINRNTKVVRALKHICTKVPGVTEADFNAMYEGASSLPQLVQGLNRLTAGKNVRLKFGARERLGKQKKDAEGNLLNHADGSPDMYPNSHWPYIPYKGKFINFAESISTNPTKLKFSMDNPYDVWALTKATSIEELEGSTSTVVKDDLPF